MVLFIFIFAQGDLKKVRKNRKRDKKAAKFGFAKKNDDIKAEMQSIPSIVAARLELVRLLWEAGVPCEQMIEMSPTVGQQNVSAAECNAVWICGIYEKDFTKGGKLGEQIVKMKNLLEKRGQKEVPFDKVVGEIAMFQS